MPKIRRMLFNPRYLESLMAHLQAVRTTLQPQHTSYTQLTTYLDAHNQIAWGYMHAEPRPCFTGSLLREIVDWFGGIARSLDDPDGIDVNYVVVASAHPGVYNLGGDLNLFRQLIEARDRDSLYKYAQACIRPLFLNALHLNRPELKTITLVQSPRNDQPPLLISPSAGLQDILVNGQPAEVTVEANPETVDAARGRAGASSGPDAT